MFIFLGSFLSLILLYCRSTQRIISTVKCFVNIKMNQKVILRFLNVFFEKHTKERRKKMKKVNNYILYQLYVRIINLFRHVLLISILFHLSIQWSRTTSLIAALISGIIHIIAHQLWYKEHDTSATSFNH